jgi:hypothetical protein
MGRIARRGGVTRHDRGIRDRKSGYERPGTDLEAIDHHAHWTRGDIGRTHRLVDSACPRTRAPATRANGAPMTRARRCVGAAVLVLGLTACGQGQPGPSIEVGASDRLSAEIADVRAAAARSDRPAAERALAALRSTVAELRRNRQITSERAIAVLAAATDVQTQLHTLPSTTSSTTSSTSTTQPRHENKGKGKDEGD